MTDIYSTSTRNYMRWAAIIFYTQLKKKCVIKEKYSVFAFSVEIIIFQFD